jgi:hypothetical protein
MSDERAASGSASPIHFEHWCGQVGCTEWGSFGKERRGLTEWRCMEHLAKDYWDGRPAARN